MSFNANTVYPAVDINTIAKQCKEAINADTKCFIVFDLWGHVESIHWNRDAAEQKTNELNVLDPEGYFYLQEHTIG
jgi:extradiol dioxygenase family protein